MFTLPIHLYFSAAANLYLVKNQPEVNVSREGLILWHSSCGINTLKASWDVHPGVKNVLDPWDKAKLETYVLQNIRLTNIKCFLSSFESWFYSPSGLCDETGSNSPDNCFHSAIFDVESFCPYSCLFLSFPWVSQLQHARNNKSFHEVIW